MSALIWKILHFSTFIQCFYCMSYYTPYICTYRKHDLNWQKPMLDQGRIQGEGRTRRAPPKIGKKYDFLG
jgi:hypothetical protein